MTGLLELPDGLFLAILARVDPESHKAFCATCVRASTAPLRPPYKRLTLDFCAATQPALSWPRDVSLTKLHLVRLRTLPSAARIGSTRAQGPARSRRLGTLSSVAATTAHVPTIATALSPTISSVHSRVQVGSYRPADTDKLSSFIQRVQQERPALLLDLAHLHIEVRFCFLLSTYHRHSAKFCHINSVIYCAHSQ